jgi:hypothetical protein
LSGWSESQGQISLREDNPNSAHTLLTFLYDRNKNIRHTIDNSSIAAVLVSAAIRYVIADKYEVEGLKDTSWDLIELALALIRAGTENFDHTQPFRAKKVTRHLCEGFFLGTPTLIDTFIADSEQGIVDLLDYVSNGPDIIPDSLPHRIGQELHRTLATSSWNCPRIQSKLAHCPTVVKDFIQRTLEASKCAYMALRKAGLVT